MHRFLIPALIGTLPALALNTVNDPVDAAILGTCPAAVHDRYAVPAPDGHRYRTWHPPQVSLDPANPSAGACRFAHEHGDNPKTSLANPQWPAFGYIAELAAMAEPHEGFKVFVVNQGTTNDEGRTALTSTRIVFHMGTAGTGRFTVADHSLQFDLIAADGHMVHVQGMAGTKLAGSICARDLALQDSDPSNDIGRTVVITRGSGCDVGSLYEIWAIALTIAGKVTVNVSTAAFDPITVMNPLETSELVYTSRDYPGDYHGCDRESYHGPVYWYNAAGPVTYRTDAYGNPVASGGLIQRISQHNDIGIPMSQNQTQFKLHKPQCVAGLGLLN
jgi:hypothetical protein